MQAGGLLSPCTLRGALMRHCPHLAEARGILSLLTITGRGGTFRERKLK
jgi:hypothetical protein